MKRERRYLTQEVRVAGDAATPKIVGYAAKFGVRSLDLGGFQEVIDPHAFDACLVKNPDILGLFNHSNDCVLGRTSSGTMRVAVDSTGLSYEIDPPDTQLARDLMVSMQRGDVRSSSFGFYCLEDTWDIDSETDTLIRTILKGEVFDCSVVTAPAYPDATSSVRSLFPDGDDSVKAKVAELRSKRNEGDCTCDCPECQDDDCADCSHEDCTCDGCDCPNSDSEFLSADERSLLQLKLRVAAL